MLILSKLMPSMLLINSSSVDRTNFAILMNSVLLNTLRSQIQNRIAHKFNLNFIISIMKFVYIQAQFMFYCEMWPSRASVCYQFGIENMCDVRVRVREMRMCVYECGK